MRLPGLRAGGGKKLEEAARLADSERQTAVWTKLLPRTTML